jgi:hypothetical protein
MDSKERERLEALLVWLRDLRADLEKVRADLGKQLDVE